MSSGNRFFRKLLLKEEKTPNDHYILAMKFLFFGEEVNDGDHFDIDQSMKHFEKVTTSESDLVPLGYYGMALSAHHKDPEDPVITKLVMEGLDRDKEREHHQALRDGYDMLYIRKILLESLEQQEILSHFEDMNQNLTLGYRMTGHAYLDSREEFEIDEEELLEQWEERDYDILKKAQENFYQAFMRGDLESFEPLYDCTLELKEWSTMFEILERRMTHDSIKTPELLRKCTILSKDFERGISLLQKGCDYSYRYLDPLERVKKYIEMRKKFPSHMTGITSEAKELITQTRCTENVETGVIRTRGDPVAEAAGKGIENILPGQNPPAVLVD